MQRSLFTPQELKLFDFTSDGLRHTVNEILAILGDEYSEKKIVFNTVQLINKKLEPNGQRIISEYNMGRYYYRRVVLLSRNKGE